MLLLFPAELHTLGIGANLELLNSVFGISDVGDPRVILQVVSEPNRRVPNAEDKGFDNGGAASQDLLPFFFFKFTYLFTRDIERKRGRDTGREAGREAGSMQGAQCGTRSWILGSHLELKADAQLLSHSGIP